MQHHCSGWWTWWNPWVQGATYLEWENCLKHTVKCWLSREVKVLHGLPLLGLVQSQVSSVFHFLIHWMIRQLWCSSFIGLLLFVVYITLYRCSIWSCWWYKSYISCIILIFFTICRCACVCTHVCTCVYVCLCMCVCIYVFVHVHVYVCVHICAHMCMCVCLCMCVRMCVLCYVCVCACMCVYVYACVNMPGVCYWWYGTVQLQLYITMLFTSINTWLHGKSCRMARCGYACLMSTWRPSSTWSRVSMRDN